MAAQQYPKAKALLDKFHAGECTPEELALLNSWYDGLQSGAQEENALSQRERFLQGFRQRVQPKPKRYLLLKWSAAAAVITLAGIAYLLTAHKKATVNLAKAENVFRFKNTSNSIKKITLPDSSIIWLNANASLQWKEENNARLVAFSGEGYFDLNRSAERPFVIVTRDLVVKVLGTTFNLEAYPDENMTRVSLASGKVQVSSRENVQAQAVLQPGQAASYFASDSLFATHTIDTTLTALWKEGGFTANQLTVKDAFTRLCESNGYQLEWLNERRLDKRISISFPKQKFEQTMDDLCYMTRKQYKITKKLVTIF